MGRRCEAEANQHRVSEVRWEEASKQRGQGSMREIGGHVSNKFLSADYPKLSRAVELRPACISPTMPKTVRDCLTSPMTPCHSNLKPP